MAEETPNEPKPAEADAAQLAPSEQPAEAPSEPDELAVSNEPVRPLELRIEVALMATDRSLSAARLSEICKHVGAKAIKAAIKKLNADYEQTGRTFRVEEVAGGYQILTLPEFGDVVGEVNKARAKSRLTPASMETLAIIAYKQPVLRAEVEAIRGVACGEVIRKLSEMRLVKIVGRAEELGRPALYGTTKTFLEVFGLGSVKDLPKIEELMPPKREKEVWSKPKQLLTKDDAKRTPTAEATPEAAAEPTVETTPEVTPKAIAETAASPPDSAEPAAPEVDTPKAPDANTE